MTSIDTSDLRRSDFEGFAIQGCKEAKGQESVPEKLLLLKLHSLKLLQETQSSKITGIEK